MWMNVPARHVRMERIAPTASRIIPVSVQTPTWEHAAKLVSKVPNSRYYDV
jgi:hypothetical protein